MGKLYYYIVIESMQMVDFLNQCNEHGHDGFEPCFNFITEVVEGGDTIYRQMWRKLVTAPNGEQVQTDVPSGCTHEGALQPGADGAKYCGDCGATVKPPSHP